ncbi:MAG: LptF/LptG family permease [Sphingobacteriales bacterium]|nr:LptF/LptG family permease [Sphingobacteriales bacterium]
MIKKLDKLILKSFIGPFIAAFFITLFVLMLQVLWKYVDDLVGKGLDFITICKFLWFASASLLTLAMPIAILISSIMTFGNLGESFELVAIKSSGISLLRFMRPLVWVALLLCGITFLFANYAIPYSNYKFKTLYYDIMYKKPALDLKEGKFFTHIQGFAIKVGKKDPDGKTIHNILIYEQQNPLQDNSIVAEKGIMRTSDDKQFLEFTLFNGVRYQERGNSNDTTTEYIKLAFKEYKKLIDLSSLQMLNTSDSFFQKDYKSFSIHQLNRATDSLRKINDSLVKKLDIELSRQFRSNIPDSIWKKVAAIPVKVKSVSALIPDSAKPILFQTSLNTSEGIKSNIQFTGMEIKNKKEDIRRNNIEWHRKFSLSVACLVLFFIGAPLGSIIRKGGIGMPLVVAIIFFLLFHLLNVFGEKFVKEEVLPPFIGLWLPIIILTPVGLFLTYKAMHDSQLFNKEFYLRLFKRLQNSFITLQSKYKKA